MKENGESSSWDKTCRFLGNVWRGVNAPEENISKTRKHIDEAMVVTGALGFCEGFALGSPIIIAASAADFGIGAADLARAGAETRTPKGP